MRHCGREPDGVEHGPAADHDHVTAAVEVGRVNALEHPLEQVNIVLDRLPAGNHLNVAGHPDAVPVRPHEGPQSGLQFRMRFADMLINPELHARRLVAAGLEQIGEHLLVASEDVAGEADPMHAGDGEVDVERTNARRIRHAVVGGRLSVIGGRMECEPTLSGRIRFALVINGQAASGVRKQLLAGTLLIVGKRERRFKRIGLLKIAEHRQASTRLQMSRQSWNVNGHVIELEHGWWSGKARAFLDGQLLFERPSPPLFLDFGFAQRFHVDDVPCVLRVVPTLIRFRLELLTGDAASHIASTDRLPIELPGFKRRSTNSPASDTGEVPFCEDM